MSGDDTNTCYIPATRLVELYEWKTLSPVEVAKESIARINALNDTVNAYIMVDEDAALAAAKESEDRWMKG